MTRSMNWSIEIPASAASIQSIDERLLKDAGLSAEEAFGPSRMFWSEWRSVREPWQL